MKNITPKHSNEQFVEAWEQDGFIHSKEERREMRRRMFVLHYEGVQNKDIAEIFHKSRSWVSKVLNGGYPREPQPEPELYVWERLGPLIGPIRPSPEVVEELPPWHDPKTWGLD